MWSKNPVHRKLRLRIKRGAPRGVRYCTQEWGPMHECHVASRYCLKSGKHCVLPDECDGTPAHTLYHQAEVTAESCRPYPLGTRSLGPDFPVPLTRKGLFNVEVDLQRIFFTDARHRSGSSVGSRTTCEGNLVERLCLLSTSALASASVFAHLWPNVATCCTVILPAGSVG